MVSDACSFCLFGFKNFRVLYDFIVTYHDALDLHQIIYLRNHFLMARADFRPFDFVANFEEICVKNWLSKLVFVTYKRTSNKDIDTSSNS